MPPADLTRLERARREMAQLAERSNTLRTELATAEAEAAELERTGAGVTRSRAAARAAERLRREHDRLVENEGRVRDTIEDLRDLIRLDAPERSVEQLDGGVPVTLLPVRLETRFADANKTLRIRVFPEQVHVDAHEPELTADELTAAHEYWRARWTAGADVEGRRAAWARLARLVRPARARWLVQASMPTNVDELGQGEPAFPDTSLKPGPWTRAPEARLLPEQWVAIGYRAGAEVFRKWSAPVAERVAVGLTPDLDAEDSAEPPPAEQETLPIDDGMRWMVDYDEALRTGMAVTVTDADLAAGQQLAGGLDELVVLGVDWSLKPEAAATALADHLTLHSVSDGLALLGEGTPTNNTDEDRAAAGTDPLLDPAALDQSETDEEVRAAGERIGRALGLPEATAFATVPGHGRFDDGPAADMNNALWAPTIGYFLEQLMRPLVASATADAAAAHFRDHVRGRGPLPCLRIGRQPYGVLPVVAGAFASDNAFETRLARQLSALRPFWSNAVGRVPRLGDSDRPDVDLVDLLRRTPRSGSFRFRRAGGTTYTSSILGFDFAAIFQEQFASMLLALAGIDGRPELAQVTVDPNHRAVPVPLVAAGELSETEPLQPNYIEATRAETSRIGGFTRLLADPAKSSSLLEALLRQASALEYTIGTTLLVVAHELAGRVLTEQPRIVSVLEHEVHDLEFRAPDDAPSLLAKVNGSVELATTQVREISGDRNLADFMAVMSDAELQARRETQRFAEFRASLQRLARVPSAELGRLAADTLDCASHRLDAWITSLATRRLGELRAGDDVGCHIGSFGYVEDLAPRAAPTSLGYLQAPSIAHATTAAVLRSGHLARRDDDSGILALDLSSTRVSLALELVEGVRRGHPIGALLGYRFERSLRDRRMTLAQYILPIRQAVPLATTEAGPADGTPVESVAARDVVDGVMLLQRWKADRTGFYAGLSVAVPGTDRADIDAELERLDAALDAVSDVLVAESVHQAVLGNTERSAAALDALDHQSVIPDVGVVRTPRTGVGYGHRLLLLLESTARADGWGALRDARQAAEPRVDGWAGALLGRPDRYRFAADVLDADETVVQTVTARLPDLGLSALGTVCACAASGAGGATELEERLAVELGGAVTAAGAEQLVLLDDPPAGSAAGALGLRDLLELGAEVLGLLASARPADRRALAPETERPAAGVDAADLRGRADGAVAALRSAVDQLAGAGSAVRIPRLLRLAAAGQRAAVPAGVDDAALAAQAETALSTARSALDELDRAEVDFDRASADDAAQVAHDLGRVRRVLGESFPVLPVFSAANGAELNVAAAADLLDGDPLAATTWLTQHALVRAGAARLTGVLTAAEMLGGGFGLEALTVAQLPFAKGDRWIGLPRADVAERPAASVSLVAHAPKPVDFTRPLAGLVVDQWSDVVPNDHETTGVSFHFDAPGARAPQTMLLAVPGDRRAPSWTVELLAGTVREAMALARMRAVDLDDLDAVGRFLPAIYLPFNIEAKTPSINLFGMINAAIEAGNLAFAEDHT